MEAQFIPEHEIDKNLKRVLTNKITGLIKSEFELYPGLSQADAVTHLGEWLEKATAVLGEGVLSAYTDMSSIKNPLGVWIDSNTTLRQKGLNTEADPKFLDKIKQVARFWEKVQKVDFPFLWAKKNSNIGAPSYSISNKTRVEAIETGLNAYKNLNGLTFKAFSVYRSQADPVVKNEFNRWSGKPRQWMYPLEMFEQWRKNIVNEDTMDIKIEGNQVFGVTPVTAKAPFLQYARGRFAQGLSYIDNSFWMLMRQTLLDPHLVSEKLWVHRGPEDILMKTQDRYIVCLDFSNFERTVTVQEMQAITEVWQSIWPRLGDQIGMLMEILTNLSYEQADIITPPATKRMQINYIRSTANKQSIHGIISGIGITDVLGKIIGTAFCAYILEQMGYPMNTLEDYERFILNMGDDNVLMVNSQDEVERLEGLLETQKVKAVTIERPPKFLGNGFRTVDGKVKGVYPYPVSFIVNSLCPEHEAGHIFRKYSVYGLEDRWQLQSKYLKDDETYKVLEGFYLALKDAIPKYEYILESEKEAIKNSGDIQEILQKYNLRKAEEIYYILRIRDLPREDAEKIGIIIPAERVIEILPALGEYLK